MEGVPQVPHKKEAFNTQESNRLQKKLIEVVYKDLNPSDAAFEWAREEKGTVSYAALFGLYEKQQREAGTPLPPNPTEEDVKTILEGMEKLRSARQAA